MADKRKPFLFGGSSGFTDMLRRASDSKARGNNLAKGHHSEHKKPYRNKGYNQMEQLGPGFIFPNFPWEFFPDFPDIPPVTWDPWTPDEWPPIPEECLVPPDECSSEDDTVRQRCVDEWAIRCGRFLPICSLHCFQPDCEKNEVTCCVQIFNDGMGCLGSDLAPTIKPLEATPSRPLPGLPQPTLRNPTKWELVRTFAHCATFAYSETFKGFLELATSQVECGASCQTVIDITKLCCCENPVISGLCTMGASDTLQLTVEDEDAEDCCSSAKAVDWSITGTDATIDDNGLVTTGASACGTLSITGIMPDTTQITFKIRVTAASEWSEVSSEDCVLNQNCGCQGACQCTIT